MTKTCAMIDANTGEVVNMIVADPARDKPWPGHLIVEIEPGRELHIDQRWHWEQGTGFVARRPELVAEVERHEVAKADWEAREGYHLDEDA
jgi:hypothetical protein